MNSTSGVARRTPLRQPCQRSCRRPCNETQSRSGDASSSCWGTEVDICGVKFKYPGSCVLLLVGGEPLDEGGLLLNGGVVADGSAPVPQELLVDALQGSVLLDLGALDSVSVVLGVLVL